MKILIRTPKFIGDTIMMLPALFLLQDKYSDAHFTIVCNPHFEALFRGMNVTLIIDESRQRKGIFKHQKLLQTLRQEKYDLGILFHNSLSSALLFKLAYITAIIGYKNDGRQFLLDFAPKIDRARHYINHYANLVNLYLDTPYTTLPKVVLHSQNQTRFSKHSQPTIAFVLGSEKGYRGYPEDLSLALCELLQNKPYQVLFLGDKEDAKTNALYAKALPDSHDFSGTTSVAEFIDIIADVDLLITIDTSAMHIAAATGTKFITLLGKGTSAFSLVQPKVDFGSYLYAGEDCIDDASQIRALKPKVIIEEIEKRLS